MTESFLRDGLGDIVTLPTERDLAWAVLRGPPRIAKLATAFGYGRPLRQSPVLTRDGQEDGGWLLPAPQGHRLRAWSIVDPTDLDGPLRANRNSPTRIAQRVLRANGERAGLLTSRDTIRLLICDPAQSDSHLSVGIASWPATPQPPDSFRLLKALAGADTLPALPRVLEAARLHQTKVTTTLRRQAKQAIVGFINALPDRTGLDPKTLWHEALILVYRLLFILKLESPAEPGAGFSFAATKLWRDSLSPNRALGPLVRRHLDQNHDTGHMLESGLRRLFAIFRDGITCSELTIVPLGGALFAAGTTSTLDRQPWGDRAVAILLDQLIWIASSRGERRRVHYGSLDVEDLGSIYEGLLEQEPGIATQPLVRLRRDKTEFVVPAANQPADIAPGTFFLRSGTARKSSGSFYTPHEFVRFLVRQTLDPKIAALSPPDDPHPARLLTLTIVDPATGSGHFLVEACRHLGEALLTACRQCDERALHDRIAALPDPDNTVAAYLPSRGFSEARARAICRRLVAVHCLYGCDRNKLAVELAKLSLWLESYAEGLPLTFLDHRLVHGDALTGPFFADLTTLPVTGGPLDPLLAHCVTDRLAAALRQVRTLIADLDATIGRDIADLHAKQAAKDEIDRQLQPLRKLAQAWSAAAMRRDRDADDLWLSLATHVADTGSWPDALTQRQAVLTESAAVPWDLQFPEVFPTGFSVVLGNPPWDIVLPSLKDFVADHDPAILDARSRVERAEIETRTLARPGAAAAYTAYKTAFEQTRRIAARLYRHQHNAGNLDLFRLFAERNMMLTAADGAIGTLLPSAFHANAGTTEIRRLYLEQASLTTCLSFENRRRIFAIDSRFKFDLVVAHRPGPTTHITCGFYLDRIEDAEDPGKIMNYTPEFLVRTGGTPMELKGPADLAIAETMLAAPQRLGHWCRTRNIRFGNDLHMTADSALFQQAGRAPLILHEGKTFHQYTDSWDHRPRYSVAPSALKPATAEAATHPRLVFRDIARSNDERTMIACVAPPGTVFGHTATVEKTPQSRDPIDAFTLCALFNSFPFDWLIRQKAATHLSLYLLNALPVPSFTRRQRARLAQAAQRLTADPAQPPLRAQADAIVAHAYNLTRTQYAHLLQSFSHRSNPDAPARCLAAFDAAATAPG